MPEIYAQLNAIQKKIGKALPRYAGYGVYRTRRQTLAPPNT